MAAETEAVTSTVRCVPDSVSVSVGADSEAEEGMESEFDRVFEEDADIVPADVRDGVAPENVLVGVNGELELGVWLIDVLGVSVVVCVNVRDGVAPENVLVGVNGELELGVWLID
eukprot:PhM_4_TR17450/c3_g1_i6/m.36582